jgi:Zn-dependent peptidase ImmA (M78 family)
MEFCDEVWKLLIIAGISELPVKPTVIARSVGISILKENKAHILPNNVLGLTVLCKNKWYIVYDDNIKTELARIVIAHELGHIFLRHNFSALPLYRLFSPAATIEEHEAEMFALKLLSPTCILWALNLHTPAEIAEACQIPIEHAAVRAEHMQEFNPQEDLFKSPLEWQVYSNFKQFIQIKNPNL